MQILTTYKFKLQNWHLSNFINIYLLLQVARINLIDENEENITKIVYLVKQ